MVFVRTRAINISLSATTKHFAKGQKLPDLWIDNHSTKFNLHKILDLKAKYGYLLKKSAAFCPHKMC